MTPPLWGAPAITLSPEISTAYPNRSPAVLPSFVSRSVYEMAPVSLRNLYNFIRPFPLYPSSPGAPTTKNLSDIATELPKSSLAVVPFINVGYLCFCSLEIGALFRSDDVLVSQFPAASLLSIYTLPAFDLF